MVFLFLQSPDQGTTAAALLVFLSCFCVFSHALLGNGPLPRLSHLPRGTATVYRRYVYILFLGMLAGERGVVGGWLAGRVCPCSTPRRSAVPGQAGYRTDQEAGFAVTGGDWM
ncbi:hypothetical protein F5B22DRAFT_38323 [Xylaria bambusicola]|uniref:uncharacterized protein n=1 Tax=Xylaria bambusicola TaxID=326684 RepID=UPI002008CEB8|nr:uncharacterized protein F5B22DRAFT_38323 [Xylaria bambusicola]KAI0521087.1 hypothetical protein F5B22DRAFT_38323 [Xylaria bambusicola]